MGENRGGIREGSGRKPIYDQPTKTMRVPVSRILEIKHFLADTKNPTFNDVASIKLINPETLIRMALLQIATNVKLDYLLAKGSADECFPWSSFSG